VIGQPTVDSKQLLHLLSSIAQGINRLADIAEPIKRLADHLVPLPESKVGTSYIAKALGVTTTWVAEMVRNGELPSSCIVAGTGNGKLWKFYRVKIDEWIKSR
jgi:hypothetical protein